MTRVLFLTACSRCSVRQAVQAGHLQVQQEDVGLVLLQDIQHLPAILRLRHDFEILFQGQQLAQPVAEDRMIVGYHDPDLGTRGIPAPDGGPFGSAIVVRHTFPL